VQNYRITTPVPGHTEVIGTVAFAQGVAFAEAEPDAPPLQYFRAQGYTIEVRDGDEWVPETPPERRRRAPVDVAAQLAEENEALRARIAALEGDPGDAAPAQPARNASTEAWRAWAVEHGDMSADEADQMSRDQLVERFADQEGNR
jgi:hypothetical protein